MGIWSVFSPHIYIKYSIIYNHIEGFIFKTEDTLVQASVVR